MNAVDTSSKVEIRSMLYNNVQKYIKKAVQKPDNYTNAVKQFKELSGTIKN